MERLLSVAIPTFNRAEELDRQLAWFANAVRGFELVCELIISDNCSTDETPEVVRKWQSILTERGIAFQANRNEENIGLVRNIAFCLSAATSQYVWAIGDDDPIDENALSFVIEQIKTYPDLTLLYLNFLGRVKATRQIKGEHWFESSTNQANPDGKAVFARCLEKDMGSVIFITATVYRTVLVQAALNTWTDSIHNYMGQIYWAGYCAAHGSVSVTKDNYLECILGASSWMKDPKHALMMQYKHTPEAIMKLQELGYSQKFCRSMVLKELRQAQLRVVLGAFRRWPLLTLRTLLSLFASLSSLVVRLNSSQIETRSNPVAL
jgi:hypothetical protein